MEVKSRIFFADKSIENSFRELEKSKTEDNELHRHLSNALGNLKRNVYSGIQIPKRLIPKIYIREYNVENLWKYDLPRGWRLIYTVSNEGVVVLSVILEWMDHKEYDRRFNY